MKLWKKSKVLINHIMPPLLFFRVKQHLKQKNSELVFIRLLTVYVQMFYLLIIIKRKSRRRRRSSLIELETLKNIWFNMTSKLSPIKQLLVVAEWQNTLTYPLTLFVAWIHNIKRVACERWYACFFHFIFWVLYIL